MSPGPVGVLALQGDVREHVRALTALGADARPVRSRSDLDGVAGLVLPGGESGVIDKLARRLGLAEPIRDRIRTGMPVYGTCAGLILLADRIADGAPGQETFGGIDATARRNAFGRQLDSFEADLDVPVLGERPVHATFIRAPALEALGPGVEPLAALADGRVVAARSGALLVTAFHPEVAGEDRFHRLFLDSVEDHARSLA